MRGVFPGDLREMKNQEQNYNPYGDDESPIDLSKKSTITKRKQPESINDKQYQEEYIRGDSPALSEEENDKKYEFLHAIQKMSALGLPPFLHPWLMVNPQDLARVSGARIGLPNNALHVGTGYQAYGTPNPCILNPLSLASLYPLVSEHAVPYSVVNYHNGSHTESVPSRPVPRTAGDATKIAKKREKAWYCDQYSKDWKTPTEMHRDSRFAESSEKDTAFTDRDNCHLEEDANSHNRCASTPPDADCKNRQKLLSIRHLRDTWRSDSKLLTSKATKISHNKSKSRFASDGSLDNAILRLHFAKNKRSSNLCDKDFTPPSNFGGSSIRRSHSCTDLSHSVAKKNSTRHRYHSGYASDNETFYGSPFSSSQCSLYSAGSKKESTTDLGCAYKRKSYAPSDDSDVESEKSLLSIGSESPPGKKPFQDAKRLKSLRSLSEPSIRKKVAPPSGDYATPTDLSMKSSVPLGKNPDSFLQQLSHSPQTEIPWRVYGYYNHLLQRFREEEIVKRHSSYHSSEHHKEHYPVGSEAGLSPPPSPSPETYSPLTSSGAWMESSRSGDYGRDESPDSSILSSDPNNRKRPCRALTGKHVKHGTGASPSTLITLRQKIQERQKAKELGIAFDKGENGDVKSKTNQNKKSHHSRSNSNKRDRAKQGTKFLPSTSLQSKDQNV